MREFDCEFSLFSYFIDLLGLKGSSSEDASGTCNINAGPIGA